MMNELEKSTTPPQHTHSSTKESDSERMEPHALAKVFAEAVLFIKSLPHPDPHEVDKRRVILGPSHRKNVLVVDLDETLMFSIQLEGMEELGIEDNLAIRARPYARELLQRLHTLYDIVVFTAAEEAYARRVVELLDPSHEWIMKVLWRDHCIPLSTGELVKDLRVIADRSLDHVLIIDNNILSFAFQLPNGIPVTSYDGANDDDELFFLIEYLEKLSLEANPVAINSARIGLQPLPLP